ncbi:MAG TPA: tRNA (N(6)-L-threonylcarbamoyladenosine(37)-C(2))-methylthiotransferase MtaB, partial [Bacteroidales bacterium]|nr:tRNA (N(6)-L-threonylcarbamoyladenosine(37)-C(2))-methylthiotransferase MtaB [Bacteroidales bacterium]
MNTIRKKVAFLTLGCKLNFAETSAISRMFPDDQYERVPANTRADIYIINTCSVTGSADKKCRQAIRKLISQAPEAYIAVVGCYAQLDPLKISEIRGIDLILGTNEKYVVRNYIQDLTGKQETVISSGPLSDSDAFHHAFSIGDRTRSFLKVQDGCDYCCAYCTVPLARGGSRNPPIASLVTKAEKIAAGGVKEIVLTGVNTGDFGKSTGESFTELLRELVKTDRLERVRVSSIEPNLLTDELIDLTATEVKIMPHFHIPLQSGCDKILRLMRRRYTTGDFSTRIDRIRKQIPSAGIGADIITGFPGETEADFEETCHFLEGKDISYLHVFPFSARPGTMAEKMPGQVKYSDKERRTRKLIAISQDKQLNFYKMNIGRTYDVLFESSKNRGLISGFTPNYIRVWHPWKRELPGCIKKATLTK